MVTSQAATRHFRSRVLSAPAPSLSNLSQARLTQTLDLSGYKSGRHTFSLGRQQPPPAPGGSQAVRIQPNPITLTLAATITRTLPIKPALANNPAEGSSELPSAHHPPGPGDRERPLPREAGPTAIYLHPPHSPVLPQGDPSVIVHGFGLLKTSTWP